MSAQNKDQNDIKAGRNLVYQVIKNTPIQRQLDVNNMRPFDLKNWAKSVLDALKVFYDISQTLVPGNKNIWLPTVLYGLNLQKQNIYRYMPQSFKIAFRTVKPSIRQALYNQVGFLTQSLYQYSQLQQNINNDPQASQYIKNQVAAIKPPIVVNKSKQKNYMKGTQSSIKKQSPVVSVNNSRVSNQSNINPPKINNNPIIIPNVRPNNQPFRAIIGKDGPDLNSKQNILINKNTNLNNNNNIQVMQNPMINARLEQMLQQDQQQRMNNQNQNQNQNQNINANLLAQQQRQVIQQFERKQAQDLQTAQQQIIGNRRNARTAVSKLSQAGLLNAQLQKNAQQTRKKQLQEQLRLKMAPENQVNIQAQQLGLIPKSVPISMGLSKPINILNTSFTGVNPSRKNPMQMIQSNPFSTTRNFRFFSKPTIGSIQELSKQPQYATNSSLNTYLSGISSNLGSNLNAYPQWALNLASKNAKNIANRKAFNSLVPMLTDQNNQTLRDIAQIDPDLNWDPVRKRWVGKGILSLNNPNNPYITQRTIAKAQTSIQILAQQADQQMMNKNVPQIVQILTNANQNLSKTGVGPIKPGGVPLYVGRWIDPQSGTMKLFPKASNKFINPLSKNQKIGYLQAKILNNWNDFVKSTQQYQRVNKIPDSSFKNKVAKKIQRLGNTQAINKKQFDKFKNQLQAAHLKQFWGKPARQYLWSGIDTGRYIVQIARGTSLAQLLAQFQNNCTPKLNQLNTASTDPQVIKFVSQILSYYQSIIDGKYNDTKALARMLVKASSIPENINPSEWAQIVQQYNSTLGQMSQQIRTSQFNLNALRNFQVPKTLGDVRSLQASSGQWFQQAIRPVNVRIGNNNKLSDRLGIKYTPHQTKVSLNPTAKFLMRKWGWQTPQQYQALVKIVQNLQNNGNLNFMTFQRQALAQGLQKYNPLGISRPQLRPQAVRNPVIQQQAV